MENKKANEDLTVLVLRGGPSAEREISLLSGRQVAGALIQAGFKVVEADIAPDDLSALDGDGFDVVFPVLHGTFGEDGQLQAILEERGLCYAGSDVESSRLAMDKYRAKEVFHQAQLLTSYAELIEADLKNSMSQTELLLYIERVVERIGVPCMVKPNAQGSSIGLMKVNEHKEAVSTVLDLLANYGDCLIERFVGGRELTVGILGDLPLPVLEIRTKRDYYNYQAKYEDADTQYYFDMNLSDEQHHATQNIALRAFNALGCRDFGRVDMILDDWDRHFILELNTIPGLTDHSLVPRAAAQAGMTMAKMCGQIVRMAYQRSIINV